MFQVYDRDEVPLFPGKKETPESDDMHQTNRAQQSRDLHVRANNVKNNSPLVT